MKYLIFSDESGRWSSDEEEYYIRSWIRITQEQYDSLQKEVLFAKYKNNNLKELKWENFKRDIQHNKHYQSIFGPDFKIFVTISKPKVFWSINYRVITTLENLEESELTGDEKVRGNLKQKFINSARMVLFLNYYERQHIENSKFALLKEDVMDYEYTVDTPQFLDREWKEVAKEAGIENVEIIKKSEKCPGIELADIVCGCISGKIQNNKEAKTIYTEFIKPKMLDMYMRTSKIANPNLIFINDFSEEEKKKLDIFR